MEPGYIDINIHNDMKKVKDEYIKHLEDKNKKLELKVQNLQSLLTVEHHYLNRYE